MASLEYHREYNRKWSLKNKEKLYPKRVEYRRNNPHKVLFYTAKQRAKKHNIPFDLEIKNIVIPKVCPVLGIPLYPSQSGRAGDNSPSLDRIIPELGYVKGNIKVISWRANSLKKDATEEEMTLIAKYIKEEGKMTRDQLYDYIEDYLEDSDFQTILEQFDLSPQEVFYFLYTSGKIDEDLIILPCDE